tara:strand:+ start:4074 stop:4250 length:177 start_codon:yes stop_codon:yes gene_type:complete
MTIIPDEHTWTLLFFSAFVKTDWAFVDTVLLNLTKSSVASLKKIIAKLPQIPSQQFKH